VGVGWGGWVGGWVGRGGASDGGGAHLHQRAGEHELLRHVAGVVDVDYHVLPRQVGGHVKRPGERVDADGRGHGVAGAQLIADRRR
jgi:hypothetical protein